MTRQDQSITLSVTDRDKAQLEALALEFGMKWGDRPNISKLVKAIAQHKLLIAPNNDWKDSRLEALKHAIDALTDLGKIEDAQIIAELLLSRSELPTPLRREVEQFFHNPPPPWRLEIERYIRQQQPFELTYQDAAENTWQFHIHHAKIGMHEDRQYLDCWCEETEGNQDLGELQHNRCLRLDRIPPEAAIAPLDKQWRSHLSQIEIEIHLFSGLAFGYKTKQTEDVLNEWLTKTPPVRRVIRKVSNTFWFFREILRYGEDCEIVSPDSVRQRFQQKIKAMRDRYQID